MKNISIAALLTFGMAGIGFGQTTTVYARYGNYCGGPATNPILASPQVFLESSYPNCTVKIYNPGTTTLAVIYADSVGTVKANPFTADRFGYFYFYDPVGTVVDINLSGSTIISPITWPGVYVGGGSGGGSSPPIVLLANYGTQQTEVPSGVVNGINPTFMLLYTPNANSLDLINNGLHLSVSAGDYTITGKVITFNTGAIPLTGDQLLAHYAFGTSNEVPANVKLAFGCAADGVTNDVGCVTAAFASGKSLYFPDGSYYLDLHLLTAPWYITGYSNATVQFSKGAKWVINPPTNLTVPGITFYNWANVRLYDPAYTMSSAATCFNCASQLYIQQSHDVSFDGFVATNPQSAGIVLDIDQRISFDHPTVTSPTRNGIFVQSVRDLKVTNGYFSACGDDCIDVGQDPSDTSGTDYGAEIANNTFDGSNARCLNLSSPGILARGNTCRKAQVGGIGVEYLSTYSPPLAPTNIVIDSNLIEDIRNLGQATDASRSENGIYLDADGALGNVTIVNNIINRPDGRGVGFDGNQFTGGSIASLTLSNNKVNTAGNSVAGTLDGSCYYLTGLLITGGHNDCNTARSYGYFISSGGVVTLNGGTFFNTNTTQGGARAISVNATTYADIGNMNIYDSRTPALSYILYEATTPTGGTVKFHDINFYTPGGTGHNGMEPVSITGLAMFNNLWPAVDYANIPSTLQNNSSIYCSTCDTPTSQGATCTNAGDHAGALMQVIRGVKKCY